jgi:hypothetical protein
LGVEETRLDALEPAGVAGDTLDFERPLCSPGQVQLLILGVLADRLDEGVSVSHPNLGGRRANYLFAIS